jgi:predicted transcriptional regulator
MSRLAEDWVDEFEGFSTRFERAADEIHSTLSRGEYHTALRRWLQAAFDAGMKVAREDLQGVHDG